ncbi:MAG TPA: hypothetical protein VGL13_01655 [Polyangiaceae bacterium]|jgi:hypothetical protein
MAPGPFTFSGGFAWDQLVQAGFGTPVAFDPATIMSIQWLVGYLNFGQPASADNFDFTLDDVAFQASLLPPSGGGEGGGTGGTDGGRPPPPPPTDGGPGLSPRAAGSWAR